ncbi:MAG: ribulose-phosphate 3-epimerase [Candidatus Gracilibacteria bacterium]|jgi:ribulose-phosphate 3-epimerase
MKIAPSILSADFGRLNEEIASIEKFVDWVHVDVMDGHFVPNLTIGAPVVKCIKTNLVKDVHLMIDSPEKFVLDFAKAGTNYLTVHYEACPDLRGVLGLIRENGMKCGVSVKPGTPIDVLKEFLEELDLVLVMSVEPGFGGQKFMESALGKISWIRDMGFKGEVSVDGGINDETGPACVKAGASVLVAGNYIFGAESREEAVKRLKKGLSF